MLPAISEEQDALFTRQVAGPPAIEVNNGIAAEPNSVVV